MAENADLLANCRRLQHALAVCADRLAECIEPGCDRGRAEYLVGCIRIDLRRLVDDHAMALATLSANQRFTADAATYQRVFDIGVRVASACMSKLDEFALSKASVD